MLSACNTASGKLNKGEGLVGLTRAFRYAGVPSMLVSLWNVDDRATSDIMTWFYAYLRQGLTKSQALRKAKLDYLRSADSDHADPFYWAPFVLIGDQSKVQLEQSSAFTFKSLAAVFILLAGVVLFISFRKNRSAGA